MVELYNELLCDLLTGGKERGAGLALVDDPAQGIRVAGLLEEVAGDADQAMRIIQRGLAQRAVGSTVMNEVRGKNEESKRTSLCRHVVLQTISLCLAFFETGLTCRPVAANLKSVLNSRHKQLRLN